MRRLVMMAVLVMAGCAPAMRTGVEVVDDPFRGTVQVIGPHRQHSGSGTGNRFFLRSWVDRQDGEVSHQVYVTHAYSTDWRTFTRAADAEANELEVVRIDSDVRCSGLCTYFETFGVMIPDDLLRTNASGYAVKAFARSGHELLLEVDADQIADQLARVDSVAAVVVASRPG